MKYGMIHDLAIIGTRHPSVAMVQYLTMTVRLAITHGFTCITGGAPGVDQLVMEVATKMGHPDGVLAVVPSADFERAAFKKWPVPRRILQFSDTAWFQSVDQFHPAPDRLTPFARRLHARNYGIVDLADAVCAGPRPDGQGGTAQGMRIAPTMDKPVWDIRFADQQEACWQWLQCHALR